MKQPARPHVLLTILGMVLAITFYACSKDAKTGNISIVGKWAKSSPGDRQEYEFKSDMTYQLTAFTTDPLTSQTLGYRYKTVGKYKLMGKELTLYNNTSYANNTTGYGPENALTQTGTAIDQTFTVDVNNTRLDLYFTCPPNASCIPSPIVYNRQ